MKIFFLPILGLGLVVVAVASAQPAPVPTLRSTLAAGPPPAPPQPQRERPIRGWQVFKGATQCVQFAGRLTCDNGYTVRTQ
jgi:hypothetical protein